MYVREENEFLFTDTTKQKKEEMVYNRNIQNEGYQL